MIYIILHLNMFKGMLFVYSLTAYKPVTENGHDEDLYLHVPRISTAYLIMFNHLLK